MLKYHNLYICQVLELLQEVEIKTSVNKYEFYI